MIKIALYFSSIFDLVWPTRLTFLAMGEVLCDGFNLAVSSPGDSRCSEKRIVLLPLRIKIWGLFILIGFTLSTSCHLA